MLVFVFVGQTYTFHCGGYRAENGTPILLIRDGVGTDLPCQVDGASRTGVVGVWVRALGTGVQSIRRSVTLQRFPHPNLIQTTNSHIFLIIIQFNYPNMPPQTCPSPNMPFPNRAFPHTM